MLRVTGADDTRGRSPGSDQRNCRREAHRHRRRPTLSGMPTLLGGGELTGIRRSRERCRPWPSAPRRPLSRRGSRRRRSRCLCTDFGTRPRMVQIGFVLSSPKKSNQSADPENRHERLRGTHETRSDNHCARGKCAADCRATNPPPGPSLAPHDQRTAGFEPYNVDTKLSHPSRARARCSRLGSAGPIPPSRRLRSAC